MKKRIISLFLVAVLIAAMLPLSTLTAYAEADVLSEVEVWVTRPKIGTSAKAKALVAVSESNGYSVEYAAFFENGVENTDPVLIEDRAYTLLITLKANSEYDFAPDTHPTVNGAYLQEVTEVYNSAYSDYSAIEMLVTLIPKEARSVCTVSFDKNGGKGTMDPVVVSVGSNYQLPACGYTKTGRVFYFWSVNGERKNVGDSITVSGDTVATALWRYTKTITNDDSFDNSCTDVIGQFALTDTRTGNVYNSTVYDEVSASSYDDPKNPSVSVMTAEAKRELQNADPTDYTGGNAVSGLATATGDPVVKKEWDNRKTTLTEQCDAAGDFYLENHITGKYGRLWTITVTRSGTFTSPDYIGFAIGVNDKAGGYILIGDDPSHYQTMNSTASFGMDLELTAVANDGYTFKGWYGGVIGESYFVEGPDNELISTDAVLKMRLTNWERFCAVFERASGLKGDVNADGKVDNTDAVTLKRYVMGWTGYASKIKNMAAADLDGNGSVNNTDAVILKRCVMDWSGYKTKYIIPIA